MDKTSPRVAPNAPESAPTAEVLRRPHLCFKRGPLRNSAGGGGWGGGFLGRVGGGCCWGPGGCTRDGAAEDTRGARQVASQSWRLQGHHLDYFSGLFFTSTLADGARKSTIFLGLQENQPLSESGTWDSIRCYHPGHRLHQLLSNL